MAVVVSAAVFYLPLAPPTHVHRAGLGGRSTPLVHTHQVAARDLAASPADHTLGSAPAGHRDALFLTTQVGNESRFRFDATPGPSPLVVERPPAIGHLPERAASPVVNGPPGRVWLTRGPPSSRS